MTWPVLAVCVAPLFAGCGGNDPPELWITSIEITDEEDFSRLDVELHLYDANSDEFLGCSGKTDGMEDVDASDLEYSIEAAFYDRDDRRIHPRDLRGRDVIIEVWEDDGLPCPVPATTTDGDDPVGVSGPLAGDNIAALGALSFDNVVRLTLDVY